MKRFEVVWFLENDMYESMFFSTKEAAMSFYEKHKNDIDKHSWWVTKRNAEGIVIEDYVY